MDEEAKRLARRAATQGKNSIKNAGRATKAAAEPVIDATAEEIQDTADIVAETAKRVSPRVLTHLTSEVGQGFLALSVAIYAATLATNKFRLAYSSRSQILATLAKSDRS